MDLSHDSGYRITGEVAIVSDTVPRLTGHQTQSLPAYLDKHPESYKHILDF